MSTPTPADAFEAICQIANAKRKLRESHGLMQAAMNRKRGVIVIGTCTTCGETTHHDSWSEMGRDNIVREHTRCQKCGTHKTY